jgi:DNA recombination protein RmuC
MNPTNLITSLKLIVDLWKREYQNRNAQTIADRGALLYDKFAGFVDNLKDVGDKIEKANKSYQNAYSQLATGPGNLLNQANELKKLGVKSKKQLARQIESEETEVTE